MITIDQILSLEQTAKQVGSGIDPQALTGIWRLQQTWTRTGQRPSPGTDPLLRSLGAQLSLEAVNDRLRIGNQVAVGPLRLCFQGDAELKGTRPLLMFSFDSVAVMINNQTLLQRSITTPSPQRMPFFALIGMGQSREWLAARGRGGGLAIWHRST